MRDISKKTSSIPPGALPNLRSRDIASNLFRQIQDEITEGLTLLDGESSFSEETWERSEGGGGRSRVIKNGRVFEQGGINFSEVHGHELPDSILSQRPEAKGHSWYATGTSMVLHPRNPYVPTTHLNYRYFEAGPVWWFGGGADLTPFYPYLEDVKHFHNVHKEACDSVDKNFYPVFKPWCDEYFFLKHRSETRGIGGIFYDYQNGTGSLYKGNQPNSHASQASNSLGEQTKTWHELLSLAKACGKAFLPSYAPIVQKRNNKIYGKGERDFQLYRRGRYAEFNLVWDRGTIFGLQTNGRTESILMSMPPLARWEYGYKPPANSRESLLTDLFTQPQEWFNDPNLEVRCERHDAIN